MHIESRARGDENHCMGERVESGNRPDTSQPVLQSCSLPPPCPNPLTLLGLSPQHFPLFLPKLGVSPFSTFSSSPHPPVLQGCVSRAERGALLRCIGSHETGRTTLFFPPGAAAPPSASAAQEAPPAPKTKLQRSAATVSPWAFAFLGHFSGEGHAAGFAFLFAPRASTCCSSMRSVGCVRRPAKKALSEQLAYAPNNSGFSQQKQLTNSGCI